MILPALSIRQPYAWLVANGHKDVENRTWKPFNPGMKFRGRFLIHAGKQFFPAFKRGELWVGPLLEVGIALPKHNDMQRGGVVGIAEVVDVVAGDEACASPWYFGPVGLVICNAKPLPFFPCDGQLGFFKISVPDGYAE